MTDREKAIKDLEDIIAICDKQKENGIWAGIITIDGDKIKSLKFALESIKVDRAYDLAYEKVDFIEIPEGATNGEYIARIVEQDEDFCILTDDVSGMVTIEVSLDWWNKSKAESEE